MSDMRGLGMLAIFEMGASLIPTGNILEVIGQSSNTTASKVVKFTGQFFQTSAAILFTFLYASGGGARASTVNLLLGLAITPLITNAVILATGDESSAGKIAHTIDGAIRIAAKVVNLVLTAIFTTVLTPFGLPLLGLQAYTLITDDAVWYFKNVLVKNN
jgi:hypothetical protein